MKQRGVGEYAVEMVLRQIELEEILLPHIATAVSARHLDKARRALDADRDVTEVGKGLEIASRTTAEIHYREGRRTFDVLQQCGDVRADVVVASAAPKIVGALIVVRERRGAELLQGERVEFQDIGNAASDSVARL